MNFEIPPMLMQVITDPNLTAEQKIKSINNFAVPVVSGLDGTIIKEMPPLLTKEQAEIIGEAVRNGLFDTPGQTSISIRCNKCGRIDTEIEDKDVTVGDVTENPEQLVREAKAKFRRKGWLTTWGYDLCPKCAENMNE